MSGQLPLLGARRISPDQMEIAHILFMDIVGYSRLSSSSLQVATVEHLQNIVRDTPEYIQATFARQLACRPTGDGMALIFFNDMLAPLRCAIQITQTIGQHPYLKLRMGIHSGPVQVTVDINDVPDAHGEGIIMAQRVMDCGDAGHILLSERLAVMLAVVEPWSHYLYDLGLYEIKHGQRIHLFNLYNKDFGKIEIPSKIKTRAGAVLEQVRRRIPPPSENSAKPFKNALWMGLWALFVSGLLFGAAWLISPNTFRSLVSEALTQRQSQKPLISETMQEPASPSVRIEGEQAGLPPAPPVVTSPKQVNRVPPRQPGAIIAPPMKSIQPPTKKAASVKPHSILLPTLTVTITSVEGEADGALLQHRLQGSLQVPQDGRERRHVHLVYKAEGVSRREDMDDFKPGETMPIKALTFTGSKITIVVTYLLSDDSTEETPVLEKSFPVQDAPPESDKPAANSEPTGEADAEGN